ncbi:MAG: alpha-amylase [Ignavibacteriales bacterium]|nr:alpha-amylase [Ignavibacteriales bacterium]
MNNSSRISSTPTFEFHIAKQIREKYQLDESFFSITGNVVFANFYQVRLFVQKINAKRDIALHISPGEANGAGLLHEIYHLAIKNYVRKIFPNAFSEAISNLENNYGEQNIEKLLKEFIKVFPPLKVYKNEISSEEYLKGFTNSIPNREILLEELILVHLANRNPAFYKIKEFFDEDYIEDKSVYRNTISTLKNFFKREDLKIGLSNSDLFDFLSRPFLNHSESIWDQLEFIKSEWGIFIDQSLLMKIQSSKDLFVESIKFNPQWGGGDAGSPTIVPKYKGEQIDADHLVIGKSRFRYATDSTKEYDEPEQFTIDTHWMPNLVLIAKNTYVWLDQLSKKYKKNIKTLDQIPDEELEELSQNHINGLWLIGVWERSSASKKIKHIMGNFDAVASAYSLYDYEIAHDLGGENAYHNFNERAKAHGIRLASDMVPNHTGIYSKWMIEHPDYFIQLDYPPFPNYRFTGENLSEHPDIEIRIEDQYWQMKDAAVVFERKDKRIGQTKYFYHGNDGTNMPWNDTSQLNLLKSEVREALIQKIFEVARKFSVIRFDAAMTLAKKHYSRLWFPEPGKGGDIPSRSDFALTRDQFDELFPKEFWREVVDRINTEMPDTLLLAEAFWLMEGYFVRTLGMHRVYNSAFMNMLKKEENAKYRELITNTLEFEPEILKRYVNFMSNPDEETAIAQFGSDDKYFGVLVLMSTLPGLPMFAHGQIEGYTEKYGMEYQRAYYDEQPNQWLVERHEREIFPILKKRHIFSEVQKFWIYDFLDQTGNVNENIFVYSNEYNGDKGLVVFNNKFDSTRGSFYYSRQKLNGNSSNNNNLHNTDIAYNLGIKNSDFHFYILRDVTTGLEYFFNGKDIHSNGLHLILGGFEYRVYLHFEEIYDQTGDAYKLFKENYGRGIYNIKGELDRLKLSSIHNSFENLFNEDFLIKYIKIFESKKSNKNIIEEIKELLPEKLDQIINSIADQFIISGNANNFKERFIADVISIVNLIAQVKTDFKNKKVQANSEIQKLFFEKLEIKWLIILLFKTLINLKLLFNKNDEMENEYFDKLQLIRPIKNILRQKIKDEGFISVQILLIDVLLQFDEVLERFVKISDEFLKQRSGQKLYEFVLIDNKEFFEELIKKEIFTTYLEVNTHDGKIYFSKERFEELVEVLTLVYNVRFNKNVESKYKSKLKQKTETVRFIKKLSLIQRYLIKQSDDSEYLFLILLENLKITD